MPHIFVSAEHGAYMPDGRVDTSQAEAERINAETTAAELAYWATAPERFAPAYFTFPTEDTPQPYRASFYPTLWRNDAKTGELLRAQVTTWTGQRLGAIMYARVYRHNFGSRMVAIRVKGSNGATYTGRASWDNGSVIRLRKVGK